MFFRLAPGAWHCVTASSRPYSLCLVWKSSGLVRGPLAHAPRLRGGRRAACARAPAPGLLRRWRLQQPLQTSPLGASWAARICQRGSRAVSAEGALTTWGRGRPSGHGILRDKPDTLLGDAEAPDQPDRAAGGVPALLPVVAPCSVLTAGGCECLGLCGETPLAPRVWPSLARSPRAGGAVGDLALLSGGCWDGAGATDPSDPLGSLSPPCWQPRNLEAITQPWRSLPSDLPPTFVPSSCLPQGTPTVLFPGRCGLWRWKWWSFLGNGAPVLVAHLFTRRLLHTDSPRTRTEGGLSESGARAPGPAGPASRPVVVSCGNTGCVFTAGLSPHSRTALLTVEVPLTVLAKSDFSYLLRSKIKTKLKCFPDVFFKI